MNPENPRYLNCIHMTQTGQWNRTSAGGWLLDFDRRTYFNWRTLLEEYMDADFLKLAFLLKGDHVTGVKLHQHPASQRQSNGFAYAFIDFPDSVSAHMALVKHNGTLIPGSEPPVHFMLNLGHDPKELMNHMHRINVDNLDENIDNMQLFQVVSKLYPSCFLAKVIRHAHTDISKGFGYLLFLDATERDNAVKRMNGMHIGGKKIKLSVVVIGKHVPVPTRGEYKLKVTQLDPIVSKIHLFRAFSKYPSCLSASILMDTTRGQSTHSGSVLFSDLYERNHAGVEMNGVQVGRHAIKTLLEPDRAADNSKSPALAYKLHVKQLSKGITNKHLRGIFLSKYRSVIYAEVLQNTTNEDTNMGYVLFSNMKEQKSALAEMNGYFIGGQPIKTGDCSPPKTPTTNVQAARSRVTHKIHVKDLAMNVDNDLLYDTFACRYNSCVLARVMHHPSGQQLCGFVLFSDFSEKNQALVEMAGFAIAGKPIEISDGNSQCRIKSIDRTVPVANTESQQLQLKTTVKAKTTRWDVENPPIQQQRPPEVEADDEEKDYGADGTNKILDKIEKLIHTKLTAQEEDRKSAVDRPVVGQHAKRAVTRPPAAAAGRAEVWDDSTAGIQERNHGWAPRNDAGLDRDVVGETEEVWERSSSSSQEYSPTDPNDTQDDWSPAPILEQPPRSQLSDYAGVLEELQAEGGTLNEELIRVISGILKENSPDRDEWAAGRRKRQGAPPHDDEWRDSGTKRQRNAPHGQSEPGSMSRDNPYGPGELIPRGSHQRGPGEWNQAPHPEQWGT